MIPEDVIAEIKQRADIGAVVGRSVKLKKQGKNLIGLCPFHTEKSPSFSVRPDEGYFYCFGCRAAGDVVEFLVKSTGRGFLDVLTELAAETGVAIPERVISSEESAAQKEKKRLLKVTELAQVYFRTRLASDEGRLARAYLTDRRALDDATIDGFGLGFGGASDRGLKEFLVGQGFSVDDGVKAGVLGRGERGEYDFFRHRITIPIRSARGETLSFGGRIFGAFAEPRTLSDGTTRTPPKYLNGPQTPIYDKANTLYGLYEAQPALKQGKPAILVEGYFDVIAVFRAGLQTAVAPCGTSLTSRHIEELQRRVGEGGRVVVCLDSDRAGLEAAHTAILMLLQAGLDAGFVALPEKDPDQLVKDGRTDELKSLLLAAPGALEALIDTARTKASGGIQQRVAAIDAVLPFLAAPSRQLVRQEAIRATARAFGDDEQTIAKEVEQKGRRLLASRLRGDKQLQAPRAKSSSSSTSPSSSSSSSSSTSAARPPARAKKPAGPPLSDLEVQVAKIVLCHPELAPRVALLMPHLDNLELRGFVERLLDALVRFFDLPPREALAKVPVRREGQLVALADRVRLDGPDRVIGLATALSMVEAMSRDFLERQVLEARLGALQPLVAAADADDNHGERKRLLAEQRALVAALQALDRPPGAPPAVVVVPAAVAPPMLLPPRSAPVPPSDPPTETPAAVDPPWGGDDDDPWAS